MMLQQQNKPQLTVHDVELFGSGKHYHIYNKLGAHIQHQTEGQATHFAVWAPNAAEVSVIGNFNGWDRAAHLLLARADGSGIWEGTVPDVGQGALYKYFIRSNNGYEVEKGDPYAVYWEVPPRTASVVWGLEFEWSDQAWLEERKSPALNKPISIYEVHLGSWRRVNDQDGREMTYRELAAELPEYCLFLGFTHVEFLPVMEHPFYGSWGYQVVGYYAPTSRYGTPQDFMFLVNALHQAGIGVILDWVPSHFPTDEHGLSYFDGSHLYEHADPRQGLHPDWKSAIFNPGRHEVKSFLISNALYWLDKFHIDGLRVDAVASMLYLDYSRKEGEWIPNRYGGRENLEAIEFLREFNGAVHQSFPDVITIAEESTAWPGVTHAVSSGGLGFDLKWMMGWMHDSLAYLKKDAVYRSYHHEQLSFSLHYAFSERFVLPLSHDEVVHGKRSLLQKMPGDDWQRFAGLRLLYTYMYAHPGAKLLFMGGEFGQHHEWRHDYSLDWNENLHPPHEGIQKLIKDLNSLYRNEPALYERNFSAEGFEWIDHQDATNSVLAWIRKGASLSDQLLFVANFTPVVRNNYRIGVSKPGYYQEVFNSDNLRYGGADVMNFEKIETYPIPKHGHMHSLPLTLPPLGVIVLKYKKVFDWL
ncbi:1,4-alpha-glucan branching enzyme GlgB [Dyadobacter endophyticus]|uniref:1,4-alpha-glucan branching enzyme GlgB n=1 Tax=Dyadobacter endophyticus TaxID=1749036 RepID=A0ABQ1YF05_9BACT|nr:1,4-alpha-glucan branching protein GlgB [Dyadobacter endophyticus]GGH22369.1 1,4-alpha-glucan branching enzyme GlgB [Dyadobacter endophyticus]